MKFIPTRRPLLYTPPVAAGGATTTWNPSDKNAGISLSGGNLTATTTGNQSVRSTTSHSTGKYYFEGTITRTSNTTYGIAPAGYALSNYVGNSTSAGHFAGGQLAVNNTTLATISNYGSSSGLLQMAVDLDNMNIYAKVGAGTWNNTGADPAANSGGISLATISGSVPFFVIFNGETSGDIMTVNFGATAYSGTAPSGFGNW
jgi:hypothetical protein